MSLTNITRINLTGLLTKSVKAQNLSFSNKCIFPALLKQNIKPICISTAFFTSSWKPISPNTKQSTCIDALKNPQSSFITRSMSTDHSHSKIWTLERLVSAGLLGILPLALAYPNPAIDYALAIALTAHLHWGVEAIVVDYVRPSVVGVTLSKVGVVGVYALTILTLGGLFYFNYSDVGLSQAIRMLWKL